MGNTLIKRIKNAAGHTAAFLFPVYGVLVLYELFVMGVHHGFYWAEAHPFPYHCRVNLGSAAINNLTILVVALPPPFVLLTVLSSPRFRRLASLASVAFYLWLAVGATPRMYQICFGNKWLPWEPFWEFYHIPPLTEALILAAIGWAFWYSQALFRPFSLND